MQPDEETKLGEAIRRLPRFLQPVVIGAAAGLTFSVLPVALWYMFGYYRAGVLSNLLIGAAVSGLFLAPLEWRFGKRGIVWANLLVVLSCLAMYAVMAAAMGRVVPHTSW